jgi:hypothetical protein
MQGEFDRSLFATVLLALAVLLSLTSVARFPSALRLHKATGQVRSVAPAPLSDAVVTALR